MTKFSTYYYTDIEDGVAIITLDNPNERVNILSTAMLRNFAETIQELQKDSEVRAIVIISAKKDSFVVGADIKEFESFTKKEDVIAVIEEGHKLLNGLEQNPKPVVAAINGPCVGGGLELALACNYRIASNSKKTLFALPEVKLGLLPGLGGTQRLPKVVGLQKSLEMILSGKNIYAKPAKKIGLVNALIHPAGLREAAKKAALELADNKLKSNKRKPGIGQTALERTPLNRIIFSKALETANAQTRGNYPAPAKIVEAIRSGVTRGKKAGYKIEAERFAELVLSKESKALRHLFFIQNAAKKNPYKNKAKTVNTIGILGAGLMGAGIAEISANSGFEVRLKDMNLDYAAKGKANIYKNISKRVGKGLSRFERDSILARVIPTDNYDYFKSLDLTIEAVLEKLELKQKVLEEVEAKTGKNHVFATNTSSIPISQIAEKAKRPKAVLGMHYFSPVPKMPLLEIIKTDQTADWALATAIGVGLKQGKSIIVVKDSPGFYANRIITPYMNEALEMLAEGANIEVIDSAMKDFGFPVGPIKLMDEVGIDVGTHVTQIMAPLFEKRGIELNTAGSEVVEAGLKGRKSGKGFYLYGKEKGKEVNTDIYRFFGGSERKTFAKSEIKERLSMAMINEAVYALQEGIIGSAQDADVGAVFGIGFPPFLGGPFFYIDEQGSDKILERLSKLEKEHGKRFKPADLLREKAEKGEKFYA